MRNKINSFKLWLLTLAITIFLLWLSLFAFNLTWLVKPEQSLVKNSVKLKKYLNKTILDGLFYDNRFIEKNFLLINTAQDFNIGKLEEPDSINQILPIVDRQKLSKLFNWLEGNKDRYRFAVCDVRFINKGIDSLGDKALQKSINRLLQDETPKIIFAGQFEQNKVAESIFNELNDASVLGNTNYVEKNDLDFLDYSLVSEGVSSKSLPLLLYEKSYKTKSSDGRLLKIEGLDGPMGLIKLNDTIGNTIRMWNNFVPEMLFSNDDISSLLSYESSPDKNYSEIAFMRLGRAVDSDCINLDDFCLHEKDRIIFIGAFGDWHNDKHDTIYGQTDGSVILLNIYQSILNTRSYFTPFFLVILFVVFFLISMDIVFSDVFKSFLFKLLYCVFFFWVPIMILGGLSILSPVFKKPAEAFENWIKEERHYFILIVTAVIANFWFNKVINIFVLIFVVYLLHRIFNYFLKDNQEKTNTIV